MIQGVTKLLFETGLEGHRWYVYPDDALIIQDVCSVCGVSRKKAYKNPGEDLEFVRKHLDREPNKCEKIGKHVWSDQEWSLTRDETFELRDGGFLRIYDREYPFEPIFESTMKFRHSRNENGTRYPDDYTKILSLTYIPILGNNWDKDFDSFVDLFINKHPCEVERNSN